MSVRPFLTAASARQSSSVFFSSLLKFDITLCCKSRRFCWFDDGKTCIVQMACVVFLSTLQSGNCGNLRLALASGGQTLAALRDHSFFRGPQDALGEEFNQ